MPEATLEIRLLSNVALSRSSATVGGHETLRYIPGRALLGACAARLYGPPTSDEDTWRIFESDGVTFGCALPAHRGELTVPVPLSYYYPKERGGPDVGVKLWQRRTRKGEPWKVATGVKNLAAAPQAKGESLKQHRKPEFVDRYLRGHKPKTHFSMRTAVGSDGRVRDGYLFSIEALCAGQTFAARLWCAHERDLDLLVSVLDGRRIRLGKSKATEFGLADVKVREGAFDYGQPLVQGTASRVSLLLLSDMCLRDDAGHPTLTPIPKDFELPEWEYDPGHSFVEHRVYSPYNAHRKKHDPERQVLAMGSVLTFRGSSPVDLATLRKKLERGVGWHRNEGLGQVLVAPELLAVALPATADAPETGPKSTEAPADVLGHDAFFQWLAHRAEVEVRADERREEVSDTAKGFRNLVSRAQWGEVRALATRAMTAAIDGAEFVKDLGALVGNGVGKLDARWGRRLARGKTVGEKLIEVLEAVESTERARWALDLATQAARMSGGAR